MQEGKVAGMGDAHLEACCNVSDRNERAADTIESAWTRARRSQTATALVVALAIFTDMLVYGIAVPILPDILKSMESDANQSSNKIPISPLSEHGDDASIEGSSGFPLNMDLGTAVSVLFASYAVGLLFLTPVIGIWSDRIGSRRMPMLVGLLGLAACTIVFSFAESYWLLLVARLAQARIDSCTAIIFKIRELKYSTSFRFEVL
jgi:MFS family permease